MTRTATYLLSRTSAKNVQKLKLQNKRTKVQKYRYLLCLRYMRVVCRGICKQEVGLVSRSVFLYTLMQPAVQALYANAAM